MLNKQKFISELNIANGYNNGNASNVLIVSQSNIFDIDYELSERGFLTAEKFENLMNQFLTKKISFSEITPFIAFKEYLENPYMKIDDENDKNHLYETFDSIESVIRYYCGLYDNTFNISILDYVNNIEKQKQDKLTKLHLNAIQIYISNFIKLIITKHKNKNSIDPNNIYIKTTFTSDDILNMDFYKNLPETIKEVLNIFIDDNNFFDFKQTDENNLLIGDNEKNKKYFLNKYNNLNSIQTLNLTSITKENILNQILNKIIKSNKIINDILLIDTNIDILVQEIIIEHITTNENINIDDILKNEYRLSQYIENNLNKIKINFNETLKNDLNKYFEKNYKYEYKLNEEEYNKISSIIYHINFIFSENSESNSINLTHFTSDNLIINAIKHLTSKGKDKTFYYTNKNISLKDIPKDIYVVNSVMSILKQKKNTIEIENKLSPKNVFNMIIKHFDKHYNIKYPQIDPNIKRYFLKNNDFALELVSKKKNYYINNDIKIGEKKIGEINLQNMEILCNDFRINLNGINPNNFGIEYFSSINGNDNFIFSNSKDTIYTKDIFWFLFDFKNTELKLKDSNSLIYADFMIQQFREVFEDFNIKTNIKIKNVKDFYKLVENANKKNNELLKMIEVIVTRSYFGIDLLNMDNENYKYELINSYNHNNKILTTNEKIFLHEILKQVKTIFINDLFKHNDSTNLRLLIKNIYYTANELSIKLKEDPEYKNNKDINVRSLYSIAREPFNLEKEMKIIEEKAKYNIETKKYYENLLLKQKNGIHIQKYFKEYKQEFYTKEYLDKISNITGKKINFNLKRIDIHIDREFHLKINENISFLNNFFILQQNIKYGIHPLMIEELLNDERYIEMVNMSCDYFYKDWELYYIDKRKMLDSSDASIKEIDSVAILKDIFKTGNNTVFYHDELKRKKNREFWNVKTESDYFIEIVKELQTMLKLGFIEEDFYLNIQKIIKYQKENFDKDINLIFDELDENSILNNFLFYLKKIYNDFHILNTNKQLNINNTQLINNHIYQLINLTSNFLSNTNDDNLNMDKFISKLEIIFIKYLQESTFLLDDTIIKREDFKYIEIFEEKILPLLENKFENNESEYFNVIIENLKFLFKSKNNDTFSFYKDEEFETGNNYKPYFYYKIISDFVNIQKRIMENNTLKLSEHLRIVEKHNDFETFAQYIYNAFKEISNLLLKIENKKIEINNYLFGDENIEAIENSFVIKSLKMELENLEIQKNHLYFTNIKKPIKIFIENTLNQINDNGIYNENSLNNRIYELLEKDFTNINKYFPDIKNPVLFINIENLISKHKFLINSIEMMKNIYNQLSIKYNIPIFYGSIKIETELIKNSDKKPKVSNILDAFELVENEEQYIDEEIKYYTIDIENVVNLNEKNITIINIPEEKNNIKVKKIDFNTNDDKNIIKNNNILIYTLSSDGESSKMPLIIKNNKNRNLKALI